MLKLKIKPLSFKMRNKVNAHGPWWNVDDDEYETLYLLSTLNGVHNRGLEPYRVWVKLGKDFEILEKKYEDL